MSSLDWSAQTCPRLLSRELHLVAGSEHFAAPIGVVESRTNGAGEISSDGRHDLVCSSMCTSYVERGLGQVLLATTRTCRRNLRFKHPKLPTGGHRRILAALLCWFSLANALGPPSSVGFEVQGLCAWRSQSSPALHLWPALVWFSARSTVRIHPINPEPVALPEGVASCSCSSERKFHARSTPALA